MTSAADLLASLQTAGFSLRVDGQTLYVAPADKLSESMQASIRQYKDQLIDLINTRPWVGWCRSVPRGRWQAVVNQASEAEALWHLLDYKPASVCCEKVVLPLGRHPRDG